MPVNDKARENMAYVRRLLRHRQPGFAKALESAVMLAERELHSFNSWQRLEAISAEANRQSAIDGA